MEALFIVNVQGLFAFEFITGYVSHQSVKPVSGVLIFVTLASQTHSQSVRNVSDSLRPNVFVQSDVNTHIWGAHHLFCKLTNFFNGSWGPFLETNSMDPFVHMNGAFFCDYLIGNGLLFFTLFASG